MKEDNCEESKESDVEEEEEELILEGSELHKYLQSYNKEDVGIYCNKNDYLKEDNLIPSGHPLQNMVPKEVLEFTYRILHSNLLMEEDAAYLFKISSELIADKMQIMHSRKWACGVFLLDMISLYCSMRFKSLKGILLPFIGGSTVLLTSMVNTFLTKYSYERQLKQLIQVLQKTFFIMRKTVRAITEDDSLLASKQKMQCLSRSNQDFQQEYSFKIKVQEIATMISKTASSLKTLISVARNTTFALLKINGESYFKNDDYIAFYSNEKLGINNNERMSDIAFLHNLKNIYLLMQSECLRLLGICFCQCRKYEGMKDIFNIIYAYTNESSSLLSHLEKEYEKYFYPSFDQKDTHNLNHKNFEETVLIHDMCRTLNGVLIEARRLEEFINENQRTQDIAQSVTLFISQMEKEFSLTLETLKRVKEHYLRYCSANNKHIAQVQEVSPMTDNNSNLTRTNVTVGYSDFSISGTDEVYLGSSDGIQNFHQQNVDDFNEFKPPNSLIKELKVALVKKREEFEEREMKVLKTADDIEAYKSCTFDTRNDIQGTLSENKMDPSLSVSVNKTDFIVGDENSPHHYINDLQNNAPTTAYNSSEQSSNNDNMNVEGNLFSGNLQKSLALAASSRSNQWQNMKTVDYFEDEYSD